MLDTHLCSVFSDIFINRLWNYVRCLHGDLAIGLIMIFQASNHATMIVASHCLFKMSTETVTQTLKAYMLPSGAVIYCTFSHHRHGIFTDIFR